jgi:hypothetical protein
MQRWRGRLYEIESRGNGSEVAGPNRTYPLEAAADTHRLMESIKHIEKIFLVT